MPVGARADVSLGSHGSVAERTEGPTGGDHRLRLLGQVCHLRARRPELQERITVLVFLSVVGLDEKKVLPRFMAKAELAYRELHRLPGPG